MKIKILLVMTLSMLALFIYRYTTQKSYQEDRSSFQNYKQEASKLIELQRKWSNKKEDEKLLKSIKIRFKPTSYRVQKDRHQITFERLNSSSLKRLAKTLLNSNLTFKKIDLTKKDSTVSLYIEVQI